MADIMKLPLSEIDRELCERSLTRFTQSGWRHIDPAKYVHGWHIEAISEHLEAVSRGQIPLLLINIPPRHMKSLLCSVSFPAWVWCQDRDASEAKGWPLAGPHVKFLTFSYVDTFSTRDNNKTRRLINSDWYQERWSNRFSLMGDQNAKTRYDNNQGGFRFSSSITGAATGEGGDILTIDDPISAMKAHSDAEREKVLTFWKEVLPTRLNDQKNGAIIVIMQRLHARDLSGHILAQEGGFDHLCLPARYEPKHVYQIKSSLGFMDPRSKEGELLWPERFDNEALDKLETTMGPYAASGQMQQRPHLKQGGMFVRSKASIVEAAPAGGQICRGWDLAATEKKTVKDDPDWTVGVKMLKGQDGFYYVLHVERFREDPGETETMIINQAKMDGHSISQSIPQDPGAAGKNVAAGFVRQLAGYNIRTSPETGDKVTRAMPFSAQWAAGNVRLVRGHWNEAFLDELEAFPLGSKDDQVDGASRAFNELTGAGYFNSSQVEI